jgi:hypothetical protein
VVEPLAVEEITCSVAADSARPESYLGPLRTLLGDSPFRG